MIPIGGEASKGVRFLQRLDFAYGHEISLLFFFLFIQYTILNFIARLQNPVVTLPNPKQVLQGLDAASSR